MDIQLPVTGKSVYTFFLNSNIEGIVVTATIRGRKNPLNYSTVNTEKGVVQVEFLPPEIPYTYSIIKSRRILLKGKVTQESPEISWDDLTDKPEIIEEEFETVSKNLKSYPCLITYGVDGIDTITYNLGGGMSITKTFNYTLSVLTTVVLSGDTPTGITLTKTFIYTEDNLTNITYN